MKRYIFVATLILSCIWIHYYSIDQCEVQEFRMRHIETSIGFNRERISKLQLEELRNGVSHKNEIDSLQQEIERNKVNFSDAVKQLIFYISLKNKFTMELIFLLIGASSLVYWYSHRNDEPTHPKLFWTLIFGWLYILYYVCDKKNL
jgi:hypothetical protein